MSDKEATAHCGVLSFSGVRHNRNHLSSAVSICGLSSCSWNSSLSPDTASSMATCYIHTPTAHTCTWSNPAEGAVWHLHHFSCDRGLLWSRGGPFQHQTLTASGMLCLPEGSGWMESVCVCLPVNAKPTWAKRVARLMAALTDNHGLYMSVIWWFKHFCVKLFAIRNQHFCCRHHSGGL